MRYESPFFPGARLRSMTLLDKLKPALRSAWLPPALLLIALSTAFVFGGDRARFYRWGDHNQLSSLRLTVAVNISPQHGFQQFIRQTIDDDGVTRYRPYNRFPLGGYLLMKLVTLPTSGDFSAQIYTARVFMLLAFTAAALLAYLSLHRLSSNRWIALTAVLLALSSYYLLYHNDMIANDVILDLFGVLLTFHAMVVFVQEGRFRQLLAKTCIALLLGWHVLALLLPFVIIGLVSELLRAGSEASALPLRRRLTQMAGSLLRSRYMLLGAVALVLAAAILTFNLGSEYLALDGQTPLTELPSFQSLVFRASVDQGIVGGDRPWMPFLEGQFRSILRMFIPYSLLGPLDHRGDAAESPMWLPKRLGVGLGVVLSAACLIGSMFARPRILFAALASFGFFWMLPMRNYTSIHVYETIYYVGLPLVFFTIVLICLRKLTNRDGVIAAAAVAAAMLFALSSLQMSRVGYSAESAQAARDAEQDMLAIRELTAGELVTVLHIGGSHKDFFERAGHAMDYYLRSRLIRYAYLPAVEGGFVVMQERIDTDALLTPQNRRFFLYDRNGLETWYGTAYRSIASSEPVERSQFDLYIDAGKVYYLKEPCERTDAAGRFFLHVYPFEENDLPDERKQHGFDGLDFDFVERGLLFDGKCLASVDLPQYDIVKINTGRVGGDAWSATHVVLDPRLTLEYQAIVSREPVERSEFDLYTDGGKLHYVKEPCGDEDTAARFFLHVVPENIDDLPNDRRQHGFDNLDFGFVERGLLFDGKCMASVDLPQYGITQVSTGQFDGAGRTWEVEFAPDARK